MKTVLLTGGIGSGKTAVARLLEGSGVPVFYSDDRAKALYGRRSVLDAVETLCGCSLSLPGGGFDRKKLSSLLFSSAGLRKSVEALLYPLLREDFLSWRDGRGGAPFVVFESAIALSKREFDGLWDAVVEVRAPLDERIRRVVLRDKVSPGEALERINAQEPAGGADFVIENDGIPELLLERVQTVFLAKNAYICKILEKK